MDILLGVVASAAYIIVLVLLSSRYREIRFPIVVGGVIRLVMSWVIGLRLAEIPGTTSDAREYEYFAREWAELSWSYLMEMFDPSGSYVISWVGAVIYKLTGPSPILLNIVNAAVSVWLIVLSYRLAKRLFGADRGRAAAWIVALFPYSVLYGSVFRREVFGSLFFMLGLLQSMAWVRTYSPVASFYALILFGVAGVFHVGYASGVLGLLFFAMGSMLVSFIKPPSVESSYRMLSGGIAIVILGVALVVLLGTGVTLNKIGVLGEVSAVEALEYRIAQRISDGESSYPDFLRGVDPFSSPLIIPGRIAYFLLSPFPWDIRAPSHILGFIATFYFFLILRSIIGSRNMIFSNREAAVVLIITLSAVFVFAVSIDNIGTSIRHRTKLIYPLVALCALPLFRRINFFGRRRDGSR